MHLPPVQLVRRFFLAEHARISEDLFASLNENSHEATVLFLTIRNLGHKLLCNISQF
jgi:hypothetical protein